MTRIVGVSPPPPTGNKMSKSPYKPRPPMSLQDALAQTVTDLGGFGPVADLPGVRASARQLFKYTDPSDDGAGYYLPLDTAALVSKETAARGHAPHLLHWFQEQVRGAGQMRPADEESLVVLAAKMAATSGKVFADLSDALDPKGPGGKTLTPRERDTLVAALRNMMRVSEGGIAQLMPPGSGEGV